VRVALAAAALALLAAGTACGERSEPTGANVRLYPVTVTDAQDRTLTIAQRPKRVVALTGAAANLVRALGIAPVGQPTAYYNRTGKLLPQRVRAARPNLVVSESTANGADVALGAPVYLAPDSSLDEVEQAFTRLGLLLDRPLQARTIVHRIEEQRQEVGRKLAHTRFVTTFLDLGFFTTLPAQSLPGDLISEAHGKDVVGNNLAAGPFPVKLLLQLAPAVYLATTDSDTTLKTLRKHPQARKLRAVQDGRFATIDPALLEPGPRIGDGLVAIARALHPDAFR
jgi:iron complex transport system substrate-binding protein